MVDSKSNTYLGDIRWNEIYRHFYSIPEIELRLQSYLAGHSRIVFAGFGELADRLAGAHSVKFVEYSESMVMFAKEEFPRIQSIQHKNIVEHLAVADEPVVFIICRISAYWHTREGIVKLFSNIKTSRRTHVVIDFFDSSKLHSTEVLGNIKFERVRKCVEPITVNDTAVEPPDIVLADVEGCYETGDRSYPFTETRAFFNPDDIKRYASRVLPTHVVSIEEPLVSGDPGFTLLATLKPYLRVSPLNP